MQSTWKFNWRWKGILLQLCVSLALGKFIAPSFHANWIAFALWYLALPFLLLAFKHYREGGLSYFDGVSGTFQPTFSKSTRLQIFGLFLAIAVALAALGFLVQAFA